MITKKDILRQHLTHNNKEGIYYMIDSDVDSDKTKYYSKYSLTAFGE